MAVRAARRLDVPEGKPMYLARVRVRVRVRVRFIGLGLGLALTPSLTAVVRVEGREGEEEHHAEHDQKVAGEEAQLTWLGLG